MNIKVKIPVECRHKQHAQTNVNTVQSFFFILILHLKDNYVDSQATNKQQIAEVTGRQNDVYLAWHVSGVFMFKLTMLVFSKFLKPIDRTIALLLHEVELLRDSWFTTQPYIEPSFFHLSRLSDNWP